MLSFAKNYPMTRNSICNVHVLVEIAGVFASNVVHHGFEPRRVKTKDYKLVFAVFAMSTQHEKILVGSQSG